MTEKITKFIATELLNKPDEIINAQEDLLGSNLIDSMGLMRMIAFIEEEYSIKIPAEDMIIEHFMNVDYISKYVTSKLNS